MLPCLSGLDLDRRKKGVPNTTGEFYALTANEARALNANSGKDPISLDPYLVAQGRDSDYATFRVRGYDSNNNWVSKFYYAEGLWEWVRRPNNEDPPMATLPDRQYFWREDWWALSDRFAPGVPYPQWVRNLPMLDPSKEDTKTYVPYAPPSAEEEAGMQAFRAEGHSLLADLATFSASVNLLLDIPTAYHMHTVASNIETLLTGFTHANYLAEFHSDANDEVYQATAREMYALLALTSDNAPPNVIALLSLKGFVLEFMYKALSRRTLRQWSDMVRIADAFVQRVTELYEGAGSNPFSSFIGIRAIYERAVPAAYYVKHFYYWDRFVQPPLVRPPRTMTERPSWARPFNDYAERSGLARLTQAMEGVTNMGTTLLRYGGYQFFGTDDDLRFIDLLSELYSMFQVAAREWPASGEVRSLAIRFFMLVLSLAPILKAFGRLALTADAAAKPVRVTAALHSALSSAILASDYEYRVNDDDPNSRKLEAFFWRYVSRRYTEGAWTQEERLDIELRLNEMLNNWNYGTDRLDDDSDADPVPDDTPMEEEEEEGESESDEEEEDYNAEHNRDYEAMVMEGIRDHESRMYP